MSGRNDNAFERQLEREIERLAGPDPRFDVRDVVAQASGAGSRRRSFLSGGSLFVPAALAVVLAFGGLIALSGVLTPNEDEAITGASPSPTATVVEPEEVAASKVYFADGAFTEVGIDWDRLDPLMESGEFPWPPGRRIDARTGEPEYLWPAFFAVTSSDARLAGDAVVVVADDWWEHTVTVDDIDDPLPNGLWSLGAQYGRMEIRNAAGAWEGPVGPVFVARGEDPPDGVPDNAPSLEGRVPATLIGSGAYGGLTAYVSFADPQSRGPGDDLIDYDTFEAVIVNAAPIGGLPAGALADARAWGAAVKDAGYAE